MFSSETLTVLYIEQDQKLRTKNTQIINENGFKVFETDNTFIGCELFRTHEIDILFIDLDLSFKNGLEFIRCLREKEIMVPIIITADNPEPDILLEVINLDITRYLPKSCSVNDLLVALSFAEKKVHYYHPITFTELMHGYNYNPINKTIDTNNTTMIPLTKKEYELIELLIKNKDQIVPYATIENQVWSDSMMSMDALRTLVRGIRKKTYCEIITNHNGIGYKISL